jgi:hypothetical protein
VSPTNVVNQPVLARAAMYAACLLAITALSAHIDTRTASVFFNHLKIDSIPNEGFLMFFLITKNFV